ncbi:MAG: hypothetical protein KJZ84_08750 [Bryobacteraceae bacterium]|nr:hypothetical protein [Bryobacteraceae bacterium]
MNPEDAAALLAGGGLLFVMLAGLIGLVIPIVCYWKIIGKTGHPAPLAFAFLIPMAGLVLLYWLAFSEWPVLPRRTAPAGGAPVPVPVPPARIPETAASSEPLAPVPPPAAPSQRFCTGCGSGLDGTERFCANCGKPVTA